LGKSGFRILKIELQCGTLLTIAFRKVDKKSATARGIKILSVFMEIETRLDKY